MPLHDLISLREPNPAAGFLGSEVKFKNLVLQVLRNTCALVTNFHYHRIIFATRCDRQRTAIGHRLHPIDDHVQDGLFDEINIDFDQDWLVRQLTYQRNSMLFRVGGGQQ